MRADRGIKNPDINDGFMERLTKIVCTIGPATANAASVAKLIDAGMDIVRLNFSHGSHEGHLNEIRLIRSIAKRKRKHIAILQDLPGPKIRIGRLAAVSIKKRDEIVLYDARRTVFDSEQGILNIPVSYPDISNAVKVGSDIYLNDGKVHLKVNTIKDGKVNCTAMNSGSVEGGKGVNIPEVNSAVSVITEEDIKHIRFGVTNGIDLIALSFVRSAEDVRQCRGILKRMDSNIPIIAKIEKREAAAAYKDIIGEADGIMVARGDLGVEAGIENVPIIQKTLIREANRKRKPVITATQMLTSMLGNSTPTRAEVNDIANAILDGSDAVMLSDETAVGKFPIEAVRIMDRVAKTVENGGLELGTKCDRKNGSGDGKEEGLERLLLLSKENVSSFGTMIIFSDTGVLPRVASSLRSGVPILAVAKSTGALGIFAALWGTVPLRVGSLPKTTAELAQMAKRAGWQRRGDSLLIIESKKGLSYSIMDLRQPL